MNQPSTVQELILQAVRSTPIGKGNHAVVYNFPASAPGLENYVLRVEHGAAKELSRILMNATALTPVPHLVGRVHIGQPLLALGDKGVTIHLRQTGKSLRLLENEFKRRAGDVDPIEMNTIIRTMEKINAMAARTKANPFTPLLHQIFQLGEIGCSTDGLLRNVMFDEARQRLSLIDQTEVIFTDEHARAGADTLEAAIEILQSRLAQLKILTPETEQPYGQRFKAAYSHFSSLITQAMRDTAEYYTLHPDEQKLGFAKVTDTSGIALRVMAIDPKNPSQDLVARLKQLVLDAQIPNVAR